MNIAKNEIQLIYNSNNLQDREAFGYAKSLKEHELKSIDIQNDELTFTQLEEIAEYMGIDIHELIDTNSTIYKEEFANVELTDEGVLKSINNNPELLKTPILITETQAKFLDSSFDFLKEDMTHGSK